MTEQELFKAITLGICGTLDLAKGMGEVFPVLAREIPLDEMRLNILDARIHAVKVVALADRHQSLNLLNDPIVLPLPKEIESELTGDALEDIRIVGRLDEDRATSAIRSEFYPDVPQSSMLIMRLVLDGKRQGVLLLRAEGENRYHEGHKTLVSQLNEPFSIALNNALVHQEVLKLKETMAEEYRLLAQEGRKRSQHIVGAGFGLSQVMKLMERVASLETTVLLLGETGVGKEIIADAIHETSPRRDGPLIKLNCGAIPETLIDSELFGHEKGAFTGAVTEKKGRFERAHAGTLFLDEIGELPPGAQQRLLRVLQTKTFERVGGRKSITTNARIIAATHRDLEEQVRQGFFRQDLWFRINVFPIHIPPLRDRKQDIPAMVNHLVELKSREIGIYPPPALAEGAMDRLRNRDWPGNVRELQNAIERELILRRHQLLRFDSLGVDRERTVITDQFAQEDDSIPEKLDLVVSRHIRKTLAHTNGRIGGPGGAAEILGINASTLRHRMKKLGIPYGRR